MHVCSCTRTGFVHASCKRHDTSNTGSLNKAESQAFVQHYVDCYVTFHKRNDTAMAKKAFEAIMKRIQDGAALEADLKEKMEADLMEADLMKLLEEKMGAIKKDFEAKRQNYVKNKADFDKKAFAAIDANQDGKLEEQEVVDVLTPNTAKWQVRSYVHGWRGA